MKISCSDKSRSIAKQEISRNVVLGRCHVWDVAISGTLPFLGRVIRNSYAGEASRENGQL